MHHASRCTTSAAASLVASLALILSACGAEPPELPPADSMSFPDFKAGEVASALTEGTTQNVQFAAASVGLVTLAVNVALAVPRIVFAGTVTERPEREGDEWVWRHTFPLIGGSAELRGKMTDVLYLEMHVTGQRADLAHIQDFVWYTGAHAADSGTWEIYDPGTASEPGPSAPVVRIDWQRADETSKELKFANVRPDSPKNGDTLTYALQGSLASMAIHDELGGNQDDAGPQDFSVTWSVTNGAGKMIGNDAATYCWDTLANGQVDIDCPQGEWPAP